jgi:cyclic pyranopterin phosphate synthase
VVRIAVGLGVRKIRLTGGEPLLRRDLPGLVATLAEIPGLDNLAMTTNGVLLARYARGLHASGLRHLNVSLDTLRQTRFAAITRTRSLDQVLAGIAAAQRAGFHPVKINMIPMRGCNDDEILPMARWAVAQGLHLRFIEFMPFCGNGWTPERVVSAADIRDTLARELPLGEGRRETPHAPALDYPVGSSGAVLGIIAPMTQPFCQGCSRMRLTAEGVLRPCLHADVEVSIGAALRAGADDGTLASVFRAAAAAKPAGRSQPARPAPSLRPMVRIGG